MNHYPLGASLGDEAHILEQLPKTVTPIYITDDLSLLTLLKILSKPSRNTNDPFLIFADTESDGLYINQRLLQLYIPEFNLQDQYLIDYDHLKGYNDIINNIISGAHTVWQGGNYDLGLLNLNKIPYKVDDTMAMSRLAYPFWDKFGLDSIAHNLDIDFYSDTNIDKKAMQKAKFKIGVELTPEQLIYASIDVLVLAHIYYRPEMVKSRQVKTYILDMHNLRYCSMYQQNPMQVDIPKLQVEAQKLEGDIDKHQAILVNKYNNLNVNSPKQCKEALGTSDSSKLTLITAIGEGSELARIIYDQRRLLKKRGLIQSYMHEEGVVTRYNPMGAGTGRFSAVSGDLPNGINAQQIPRALKDCFIASPGNKIVGADYPTIELRTIASVYPNLPNILKSVNPTLMTSRKCNNIERKEVADNMYKVLKDKVDLHMRTASVMTGKDPTDIEPEERFKAKAANFGLGFGMGPPAYQDYAYTSYGLVYSLKEAKNVHKLYHTTYPEVDKAIKYMSSAMYSSKSTFLAVTALGRLLKPRRLPDAINFVIQGTAAEVMKLAIHLMYQANPQILNYIIWVIHDAIYLDVPEIEASYYQRLIKEYMEKAWQSVTAMNYFKYHDVPLEVEVAIADNTKEI